MSGFNIFGSNSKELREDRPMRDANELHVALTFVLDVSNSMYGNKMDSLNEAVNKLIDGLKENTRLRKIVDLAIFVFGEKGREHCLQGFQAIADCDHITIQATDCSTYVVDALREATERLTKRRHEYESASGQCYKPWLVLVTDGEFHDDSDSLDTIARTIRKLEEDGKHHFFGLGAEGYKREQLEKFTADPYRVFDVKSSDIVKFFDWVGKSISVQSSTQDPSTPINIGHPFSV
ncbi:MAG: VWA domain-containing protein [Treponema sp.]|nr:VWA domain-containing protein [Treponema sp.]